MLTQTLTRPTVRTLVADYLSIPTIALLIKHGCPVQTPTEEQPWYQVELPEDFSPLGTGLYGSQAGQEYSNGKLHIVASFGESLTAIPLA